MAGKRQATSDLNHDNWDREEEPEERGTFRTASEDELKNRVIKKARRKVATGSADAADGEVTASKSVFSGFSGFGKPAASSSSVASPFSFLSKLPAATTTAAAAAGGLVSSSTAGTTTTTATFSFGSAVATTSTASSGDSVKPTFGSSSTTSIFGSSANAAAAAAPKASDTIKNFSFGGSASKAPKDNATASSAKDKSNDYYAKLKGLNQAVSEWIKTHVDKNPLCILTPIFKDYEKYLKELEEEKLKAADATTKEIKTNTTSSAIGTFKFSDTSAKATTSSTSSTPASTFSFSSTGNSGGNTGGTAAKTNGFSFGLKKPEDTKETKADATTKAESSTPAFSFGLKTNSINSSSATTSSTTTPSSGFTFGKPAAAATEESSAAPKPFSFAPGGTPFSFGNIKPPENPSTTETNNDDEDEEPPKNEFKQVVEEDAVYSKKCKVFVKKDGNFVDKGVGTLYLKPIESNGKTQLLVRADTNLGNILVNMILSSGIPSQRMGKNNVMLVCLPTPDVEKPTPMLLRVKTGEEADELLENIEKYKNSNKGEDGNN